MNETYPAAVTQFLRPNGRRQAVVMDLPLETKPLYDDMVAAGCRFESEVLMNGIVSTTISDGETDLDISLTSNGPKVQEGMVAMLERKAWQNV